MLVKTVTASRARPVPCFHRGGKHFWSACSMHGQHIYAKPRRRTHRRGYGVGDIVQLQIEKYREAAPLQLGNQGVALGDIKFQADFDPARGAV